MTKGNGYGIMGLRKEKASRLAGHWHETQGESLCLPSIVSRPTPNYKRYRIPNILFLLMAESVVVASNSNFGINSTKAKMGFGEGILVAGNVSIKKLPKARKTIMNATKKK